MGICIREIRNWYIKLDTKIDGINVYEFNPKYLDERNWYFRVFCPICNNDLDSANGISEDFFKKTILNRGPIGIFDLKQKYDELILNRKNIDIFGELENIINNIENIKNHFEENRYYKDKCKRENKEYYIKLYRMSFEEADKKYEFKFTDKRYEFKNWKNDENLKNILLNERKKANEKFLIEEYNRGLLEEYNYQKSLLEDEWAQITFKKEYSLYQENVKEINFAKTYNIINQPLNLANLLNITRLNGVQYESTKTKLVEYVSKFACNEIERVAYLNYQSGWLYKTEKEKKEFENFVQKILPKPKFKKFEE